MAEIKSLGRSVVIIALLGLALSSVSRGQATNPPTKKPFQVPSFVEAPPLLVYGQGGGVDLHAFIAYPKKFTGLLPAIITIHGGGWINGGPEEEAAVWMARKGYFGVSIEYRLSKVAKWPAQIEDCKLAVRWLRANAAQYHVDPNRIGVFGNSAGGHLAVCLATMADQTQYDVGAYPGVSSAVQAVGDFYGPVDFTTAGDYDAPTFSVVTAVMGMPYEQNLDAWKSASPLFFVKAGDPPVLIVHGEVDQHVKPAQSVKFDAALTKAGVEHQLIMVKNADHSFRPNPPGSQIDPSNDEINKAAFAFFDQHLKTP